MNDLIDLVRASNEASHNSFRAGLLEGQRQSQREISRLVGAIEDYLDGETQGNVSGLRQALEAVRS